MIMKKYKSCIHPLFPISCNLLVPIAIEGTKNARLKILTNIPFSPKGVFKTVVSITVKTIEMMNDTNVKLQNSFRLARPSKLA